MTENKISQQNPFIYGIIGAFIGGVIVWFLVTNSLNNVTSMMGRGQYNQQNTTGMMGNIDRHFIEQMIPHHEDAITMADIALEKAQHQEIKDLANDINRTQSAEIEQMKKWYKGWFGADVPKNTQVMGQHGMMQGNGMHMGMMGDQTDIESLEKAADFDKEFIEQMIPHHQMAIMMAQMLRNTTQREEMKKLAQNIIDAQTKEINAMRQRYKAWGY